MVSGEQHVRPCLTGPVTGAAGAQDDKPAVAVRADDREAARFQTPTLARGTQLLFGAGAGHRASACGPGGSTSVSRLKARSSRSAGDRLAKASKKPRQMAGPKPGWSP